MNMFDKLKSNKSENEISSKAIEKIETTVEKVNPYLAWETDEKLIELAEKYKEAKKMAEGKSDMLKRKANEISIKELNKANSSEIAHKSIDEIITDVDRKVSNESSEHNAYKRYLLRKAAKASWVDDKEYIQAAINYLSHILPYLEELDKKCLEYHRALGREKQRHQEAEGAITSRLYQQRGVIESYIGLHGMQGMFATCNSHEALMHNGIESAKRIVETEINNLNRAADRSLPDAELMTLNDKILNKFMSDGGEINMIY